MKRMKGVSLLEVMLTLLLMTFAGLVHCRWEQGQLSLLQARERHYQARQLLDDAQEQMMGFTLLTPAVSGSVSDYQSLDSGERLISGARGSYRLAWQVVPVWPDGQEQGVLPPGKALQLSIHWQAQGRAQSLRLEQSVAALMHTWQ